MIALIQRVTRASVTVEGEVTGEIGAGLLVLLGVEKDDDEPVSYTHLDVYKRQGVAYP